MIHGGNATIFVSNMERALDFYLNKLELQLKYMGGEKWAAIDAGQFEIGLHSQMNHTPQAGSHGAIEVGLYVREPIAKVVARLKERDVQFTSDIVDDGVKIAHFVDPDGNRLYLVEAMQPAH